MGFQAEEIVLKNNQSTRADILTFNTKTFKGVRIQYSISRGDLVEFGEITLSYNRFGATPNLVVVAHYDDTGILFYASVDANYVRLQYTSTDTGIHPIFKHDRTFFTL